MKYLVEIIVQGQLQVFAGNLEEALDVAGKALDRASSRLDGIEFETGEITEDDLYEE